MFFFIINHEDKSIKRLDSSEASLAPELLSREKCRGTESWLATPEAAERGVGGEHPQRWGFRELSRWRQELVRLVV